MFQLERKRTKNGLLLAKKLWDFLNYTVEKSFDTRWQDRQLDVWAGTFDSFLQTHDFTHVCKVFDYYVQEWIKKRGYIHLTPESFIGDYSLIEQRYEWNSRPIPESELRQVLFPLSKERWECSWDNLVTAVSKSIYSIRVVLNALVTTNLPFELKRRIRSIFGNVSEYVVRHFKKWRKHQIEAVWVATITLDSIFNEVRKCLVRVGYPHQYRDWSIAILQSAVKDGQYACNRN